MSDILHSVFGVYSSLSAAVTWNSVFIYGSIFCVSWLFYKIVIAPYLSPLRRIPGRPVGNMILGNMLEILKGESIDVYTKWIREMKTSIIRYRHVLGSQRIMIADTDAMKHVMVTHTKNYPKPEFLFRLFSRVTGKGLVGLNGQEHLAQRKLCLGAFKSSFLKNMIPSMQRHSKQLLDLWTNQLRDNTAGRELDIAADLMRVTMDIIAECGFGYDTNAVEKPEQQETQAFAYMLGGFKASIIALFSPTLAAIIPTENNRQFIKNRAIVNKLIQRVIDKKKESIHRTTDEHKLTDLLSMLVLARDTATGEGLSRQQLQDHVMTFMLAGHETTSTSLSWCLLKLSQHPDIQKRLRDEILSVLSSSDHTLQYEDLERMTYLNCVIKETLRLYPAAPMTFRVARHDDIVKGYHIPAGTVINVHVGALHRNAAYWEDPEKFYPDRFLDETQIHPYSFLPFIAGPRMCIGYKFAQIEMKVILAVILRDLSFTLHSPDQKYRKSQGITMKPDPHLKLNAQVIQT